MGIDYLDIAMRLEKRFGIKFNQAEHSYAFRGTAGTLCDLAWQKLQGDQPAIPDLKHLFREVRDVLLAAPGRPWWYRGARLERLLGPADLIENWRWLERELHVTLPSIVRGSPGDPPRIPPECDTVRRLVFWIIEHQPERVLWLRLSSTTERPPAADGTTREACWIGVREVLVDVLCAEPQQVTSDADLIDDLGMQ